MKKQSDSDRFDAVMDGLLAVPYSELQKKLADEKKSKEKKKKRPISTASRVAASGKKRAA